MSLPVLAVIVIIWLILAYRIYSRLIAKYYKLDKDAVTPAQKVNDGIDFVPTKPFYLLGQHFSAIAAAGPIAGPIIAAQAFGWAPCLLWIAFGVVLIGSVHDFSSLVASIRHGAKSIAEIIRQNVGKTGWIAIMLFIWLALIYVIVAFTDITAGTFVGKTEELEGLNLKFNPGGAVAFASIMYLITALIMGLVQRFLNPPLWLQTSIFVPGTLGVVWLGTKFSTLFILNVKMWGVVILIYCFVASLLPVWSLLQPRGYLGGFILYMALGVGLIGIFFGGFTIQQDPFKGWNAGGATGLLFPFLFVTIACGACSGFHSLVCSGTTSKQIEKETDCRMVGYGGMLLEAFVAFIALATVMIVAQSDLKGIPPGKVYGNGIGQFLTVIIGKEHLQFAVVFGAMAFSTFVFDTLDVATRLGRYIIQELFNWTGRIGAVIATLLTVVPPLVLIITSEEGAYKLFWTLFGTSNQLLAALTLLGVSVWLKKTGNPTWFTIAPMLFVMTITIWSLVLQIKDGVVFIANSGLHFNTSILNSFVALALLFLAALLMKEAISAWRVREQPNI